MLFNVELSIYAFVGIIMLVGLVKKNGIIMIDFAIEAQRTRQIESEEAIFEACVVRFRPIMMTTWLPSWAHSRSPWELAQALNPASHWG